MPSIKFIHNWNNKLSNDLFTTIRISRDGKADYYNHMRGKQFDIVLKNKTICQAVLLGVMIKKYKDVDNLVLSLDTGIKKMTEVHKLFGKFGIKPNTDVLILLFERIQ